MLIQKILVQFGSGIFLKFFALISSIVVARIAGPEVIGSLSYAISYASIFTIFTGIWGPAHIKLISEGKSVEKYLGVFVRLKIISIVLFLCFGISVIFFSESLLNIKLADNFIERLTLLLGLFAILSHLLVKFLNTTFQAKMQQVNANIPDIFKSIIFNFGKIIIVLIGFRVIGILVLDIISGILGFVIVLFMFRKFSIGSWNVDIASEYWKYAKPIIFFMLITILIKYLDKILLKQFTSIEELGYYTVAFSLAGMLLLLRSDIGIIFFPLFSSYLSNNDTISIERIINKYQEFILLFVFPSICMIIMSSSILIKLLYGSLFINSVTPFILLLLASYLSLFTHPYKNIISGAGKFYLQTLISIIKGLFFFTILYFMISPNFLALGAIGLAFSVLISQLCETITVLIISKRIINYKVFNYTHLSYILIGGLSLLCFYLMHYFNISDEYLIILISLLYLIVCYAILYSFSIINKEHKKMIKKILNYKKLDKYIKGEINE